MSWQVPLRWISVLPGAVLGGLAAHVLIRVGNLITISWWTGIDSSSWLFRVYLEAISNIAFSAGAVYTGVWIAPSHKPKVQLGLSLAVLLAGGALLFPAFVSGDWWTVYGVGALIFGAGATAWEVAFAPTEPAPIQQPEESFHEHIQKRIDEFQQRRARDPRRLPP